MAETMEEVALRNQACSQTKHSLFLYAVDKNQPLFSVPQAHDVIAGLHELGLLLPLPRFSSFFIDMAIFKIWLKFHFFFEAMNRSGLF